MADTNLGAVIGDDLAVEKRAPGGDVPEEEKQQKKKKRHRDREADARDRKRRSRDGSRSDDEKHHRKREKKSGDSESAYVDRAARGAGAAGAVQDTRDSIGGRRSDRDRDRDRRRSGSRERHRDKDRGRRERSGSRRRKRSSSPVRGRRRSSRSPSVGRRDRPRSSGHGRSRSVDRRQRDNRGRSRSPHARRNEQSRSEDKKGSKKGKNPSPERTLPTLKEILTNNPGISVTDAIQRLNMLNMQMQQAAFMGGGGAPTAPLTGVSVLGPAGALTKQQREIYVGNLPPGVSVPQITDFVNVAMRKLGVAPTALVGSVVSAWVSSDGHYAFVELRTIDEANTAMAYLSGLQIGPFALKVGRPKGLGPSGLTVPMAATPFTAHVLGLGPPPGGIPSLGGFPMPPITTSAVELGGLAKAFGSSIPGMAEGDSGNEPISNAVMAMNIPLSLTEHQIKELMSPFGPIVRFNLIADALGVAKSHTAVIEYDTSGAADAAVSGLSGIALGDSKLVLQRVPQSMALLLLQPAASKSQKIADGPSNPLLKLKPTAALQLSNMVSADDLRDDELFEELMEDVADECNSHGTVRSIVIPRPADDATDTKDFSSRDKDSGVGKIFVLFVDSAGAEKTLAAVNGRTFNGNIVEAVYYPVALLSRKVYKLPPDFDPEAEESLGISYKPIELEPVD